MSEVINSAPAVQRAGLQIHGDLAALLEQEILPSTDIDAMQFWSGLAEMLARFAPENARLLEKRSELERVIDNYHAEAAGESNEPEQYARFLSDIGYLLPEPEAFTIGTSDVDAEICTLAGPQLVVPVLNGRFLLNAANARWGSLYDALYGTDAIEGDIQAGGYDPERGAHVIGWAKDFLDQAVPLRAGSWADWQGGSPELADINQLVGFAGDNILLRNNGLHIELVVDRDNAIGATDPAGIADVVLESALTTIVDLEDSVAAVDGEDKVAGYRNWLGLIQGDLTAQFSKAGKTISRQLAEDREYVTPKGKTFVLPGRSVLLVRNVGHLMTTPAVLLPDGSEAPEGIVDTLVTSLIGTIDLRAQGRFRNSREGSIYIVKPKMHGPEEVAFADRLFAAAEDVLGLSRNTIKIGVMDEERRTSANLAACIHAVRDRIIFINTGFLDRTGDEIHTSMAAGPMLRKSDMKDAPWLAAYEARNVQIGLACGFSGKAQIGKGMWAAPDRMADMLAQKIGHPRTGANCAWVPSPTAATLHATHYHSVNVKDRQQELLRADTPSLADMLRIPLGTKQDLGQQEIRDELDNNAQGILGYVVRWIDQGVGCSKVPDINDVGLMEDRATLRISSQLLANWLEHGVCSRAQVEESFARMASRVDEQNAGDPLYVPMSGNAERSLAFQAALALVFEGASVTNGYTEPPLHAFRSKEKARQAAAEAG